MNRFSYFLILISIGFYGCGQMMYLVEQEKVNQNNIQYQISGKGPVLVFIHGGSLDQAMWAPQIKAFKKKFRVLTYDIRGHGKSEGQDNSGFEIDDLKQILDKNKIDKCYLVGQSLGAVIATDFILAYPERVVKMALISPGILGVKQPDSRLFEILGNYYTYLQNEDISGAVNALTQLSLYGEGRPISDVSLEVERYVKSRIEKQIRSGNHLRETQIKDQEPLIRIKSIKHPVMLVYGQYDFSYIESNVNLIKQEIKHARIEKVNNAGHLLNMEQTTVFNQLLSDFL